MRLFLIITFLTIVSPVYAEEVYQTPANFIDEVFNSVPPEEKILWITKDIRPSVNKIMEHSYPILKVRYWLKNKRSAWILEEIGKVKPITTGIVVNDGKIDFLKVLIYRESHGWQVKRSFFTNQFKDISLQDNHRLSRPIDGISGATMSVDALRNLTKLALFLHTKIVYEK